jgi:integrase
VRCASACSTIWQCAACDQIPSATTSAHSFAAFLGRSPDTAQAEDIRRFQVHQHESGVQPPTINCSVSALRFLFTVTLDRPDLSRRLVLARYPLKLPAVLSVEEVSRLLEAAPEPKYKAILGTAYGAGLRVSEVASLKVDDIDSTRMLIRVEQGIRRFLLHVLPHGFHRIRHYGLLASSTRKAAIPRARELLAAAPPPEPVEAPESTDWLPPCPCCGGRMTIVETFGRWRQPRAPPYAPAPTSSRTS